MSFSYFIHILVISVAHEPLDVIRIFCPVRNVLSQAGQCSCVNDMYSFGLFGHWCNYQLEVGKSLK